LDGRPMSLLGQSSVNALGSGHSSEYLDLKWAFAIRSTRAR
jgi:hypothetical protein